VKRVVVVGVTGSGKTTFASALSKRLGIPLIELDAVYWQPNWTPPDRDDFRARVVREIAGERWVAEGNYSASRDIVWSAADTLVWLDFGLPLIMTRLLLRSLRRGLTGELLWGINRERLASQFLTKNSLFLWAWQTFPRYRRDYPQLLSSPAYAHLRVARLRSPRLARSWLGSAVAD